MRRARRRRAGTTGSPAATQARRSRSRGCRSTIRSTSCIRRAPPACRSASCTAPAARCCSISRSTSCTATSSPGDRVFYFTTCGWMMWNWLVTALASGATLVLYDGSPFHPDGRRLFDLADRHGITLFGIVGEVHRRRQQGRARARDRRTISRSVRTITSTGSPLAPESFDFVYRRRSSRTCTWRRSPAAPTSSAASCGGNPNAPVWRGEIQVRGARDGRRRLRRGRPAGSDDAGRTRLHDAVSVDAGRLLERPGRREVSRRLLRAVPGRLVSRRLDSRGPSTADSSSTAAPMRR